VLLLSPGLSRPIGGFSAGPMPRTWTEAWSGPAGCQLGSYPPSAQSEDIEEHWSFEIDQPLAVHMTVPPIAEAMHESRALVAASHSFDRISHQKD